MTHRRISERHCWRGRIGAARTNKLLPIRRCVSSPLPTDAARARTWRGKWARVSFRRQPAGDLTPEVDAVIVATSEGSTPRQCSGARLGSSWWKSQALDLGADRIVAEAARRNADLRGLQPPTRALPHRQEQVLQGRVGRIAGAAARVFNSRAQALAMLSRNPGALRSWTRSPITSTS
jgi:hypothetical protein